MAIDYSLLQKQRNVLYSLMNNANEDEQQALLGVISLLESLLDEGIDQGDCSIDGEGNISPSPELP